MEVTHNIKIALFGGMANNLYVFAKALHAAGQDVCFVRDRGDSYPFSQPVWDDAPLTLPYEDLVNPRFDADRWTTIERECGWRAPDWLYDPLHATETRRTSAGGSVPIRAFARRRQRIGPWARAFETLKQADAAIVRTVDGALMAAASGLPYAILPHGGDIRLAAGIGDRPKNMRGRLKHALLRHALREAFVRANLVGSHNPKGSAIGQTTLDQFIGRLRFAKVAIPREVVPRRPAPVRRRALSELLERIGAQMPAQPLCGFIPSRVDYYWKGHDQFLHALARRPKADIHWLMSGWGADYPKAKEFVAENRLNHCVTFLPVGFSRPLLFEFMSAVDLCVDQFHLGIYGTATVETMAHGTPVVMQIDDEAFNARGWEPPPVLNASNEDDIVRILDRISSGEIDLEERGRAAAAWISRNHAPEIVVPDLVRHLEYAVSQGRAG